MTVLVVFRQRLAQALAADPRSRAQIAREAGYHAGHIRRIVKGDRRSPTLEFAEAMAGALNVSLAWLLGFED